MERERRQRRLPRRRPLTSPCRIPLTKILDGQQMTLYSKIIGTGSYLPKQRVTNQDLTEQLAAKGIETSDEWIVSRSGISARHYAAPDELSSDPAVHAARRALEM